MKYRIGLDIGIASVGWVVILNDEEGMPFKIYDLGVRCFDKAEVPKTGAALASARRDARTTRRRLRRRRHRLERIKYLLQEGGFIDMERFACRYYEEDLPNVYELRFLALEQRISDEELAQVLIHIAKHRGFRSTRKAEEKDEENGRVLTATKHNLSLFESNGYRTVGEMMYLDDYFTSNICGEKRKTTRNKSGDYKFTVLRSMLVDEVKLILEKQREFGNTKITDLFVEKYLKIMQDQRSFDLGPGNQPDGTPSPYGGNLIEKMIGRCTFEKDCLRAAKATYSFERFMLLQKVNSIKIRDSKGEIRLLTDEEKKLIVKLAYTQKKLTYKSIRKCIKLHDSNTFKDLNYGSNTLDKVESTKFIELSFYHDMVKIFEFSAEEVTDEFVDLLDSVGEVLTKYKNDDSRTNELMKLGVEKDKIDKLLVTNYSKFGHLSLKAIKKILPYLEEGKMYNVACDMAGYDFKGGSNSAKVKLIKGDVLVDVLNDIPNPVVKRSISQTFKVLNGIIQKYGSPQIVCIELAREMAKNFSERQQIDKDNKKNHDKNQEIVKQIKEYGNNHPTGQDIVKFKLWQEQDGICIYSGKSIPIGSLFEKGYVDVDHIIPYSKCFDDRYTNKVLVLSSENRQKGNRTPFEYFGENSTRWEKYITIVNSVIKNRRKRDNLLMERALSDDDEKEFRERNLTDTKYITTVVFNTIRNYLQMEPLADEKKVKQVYAVNGAITSYLRKCWGLQKNRDVNDLHHCQDAAVIACCTDGMIQKITRFVKARERLFWKDDEVIDTSSGEVINREEFTRRHGHIIEQPWPNFTKELQMRLSDNPEYFRSEFVKLGYSYNESLKRVFVSRMPHHKVTGAGHADTIRSPRHYEDEDTKKQMVVSRVSLNSLKLDKDNEIPNYYNKESDRLLYDAIKRQLQLHNNDGKKAFAEPFYKPKADGTQGPLVNKVKIIEPLTVGVYVNDGKGIAANANGAMVRIDVFCENGKYYFVPIYVADTVKDELPLRAATAAKQYKNWKIVNEEDFIFSLYPKDMFICKHKTGVKVEKNSMNIEIFNEEPVYFTGADISTVSISGQACNGDFKFRSLGINGLIYLKKLQIDVLGNITQVRKEKRMKFDGR